MTMFTPQGPQLRAVIADQSPAQIVSADSTFAAPRPSTQMTQNTTVNNTTGHISASVGETNSFYADKLTSLRRKIQSI